MHATSSSSFRITGLPADGFRSLYGLSDAALATRHARRHVADAKPGYPDRVEMRDAEVGEAVILVNYEHLPEPNPYRSSHAVYVIEGAARRYDAVDIVPEVLRTRLLSLRAFDRDAMMVAADVVPGTGIEAAIARLFAAHEVAFLHAHYAKRGCYACRVDRAGAAT